MDPKRIIKIFQRCWSPQSSSRYLKTNPARGQCSVTALVVNKHFGGEILKTEMEEGNHFYNRINGRRFDATASQFNCPITYNDKKSTWDEAMKDTNPDQYHHLEKSFLRRIRQENDKNK